MGNYQNLVVRGLCLSVCIARAAAFASFGGGRTKGNIIHPHYYKTYTLLFTIYPFTQAAASSFAPRRGGGPGCAATIIRMILHSRLKTDEPGDDEILVVGRTYVLHT